MLLRFENVLCVNVMVLFRPLKSHDFVARLMVSRTISQSHDQLRKSHENNKLWDMTFLTLACSLRLRARRSSEKKLNAGDICGQTTFEAGQISWISFSYER